MKSQTKGLTFSWRGWVDAASCVTPARMMPVTLCMARGWCAQGFWDTCWGEPLWLREESLIVWAEGVPRSCVLGSMPFPRAWVSVLAHGVTTHRYRCERLGPLVLLAVTALKRSRVLLVCVCLQEGSLCVVSFLRMGMLRAVPRCTVRGLTVSDSFSRHVPIQSLCSL